jgi:hypothetical protein
MVASKVLAKDHEESLSIFTPNRTDLLATP